MTVYCKEPTCHGIESENKITRTFSGSSGLSQSGQGDLDFRPFVSEDDQGVDALRAREIERFASVVLSSRAADRRQQCAGHLRVEDHRTTKSGQFESVRSLRVYQGVFRI